MEGNPWVQLTAPKKKNTTNRRALPQPDKEYLPSTHR
jgi:hypothetical protein